MTVIVNPSTGREVTHESASATARWGGSDWIVPENEDLNASAEGLSGAPLNEATITSSGLDVSIDTFEAFIGGAYVASDDDTLAEHTHTLSGAVSGTETTTLYLGYDTSATDTFIFGPSGDFASADPKIPIADVTDDGASVISTDDRRAIGFVDAPGVLIDSVYEDLTTDGLNLDTGTLSATYPVYHILIYREPQDPPYGEDYMQLRINGVSTSNYQLDYYDANNNTSTSQDDTSAWGRIAGVDDSSSAFGGFACQQLRVLCPIEIAPNGQHWPILECPNTGVGKNVDYPKEGSLEVDSGVVDQINIISSLDAVGFIEIRGQGLNYGGGL